MSDQRLCNCAAFGNARHCPFHTQADYDAQVALSSEPASTGSTADLAALERIEALLRTADWFGPPGVYPLMADEWSKTVRAVARVILRAAVRSDGEGLREALERGHLMWVHTYNCAWTIGGEPCDCGLAGEIAALAADKDSHP